MDGHLQKMWCLITCCFLMLSCVNLTNVAGHKIENKGSQVDGHESSISEKKSLHQRKLRSVDVAPSAEPAAEGSSEPAAEGSSEPAAEGSSEPAAEGSSEPVAEGSSEPAAEGSSEPAAEGNSEPAAEGSSEPAAKGNSEPVVEGRSEPAAEGMSEPAAEGMSEPAAEGMSEPAAEGMSEPAAEGVNEPSSEVEGAEPEAEERPQPYEILLPPITLMIIIILGLVGLAAWTKRAFHLKWLGETMTQITKTGAVHIMEPHKPQHGVFIAPPSRRGSAVNTPTASPRRINVREAILAIALNMQKQKQKLKELEDEFFTDYDLEVLSSLGSFNNRPLQLFRVSSPALISLALCPMTLYLYGPLVNYFWPKNKFAFPPDINEAIACFLAPAGLVYATSFGFAFQQALTKQQAILAKMTYELGLLDQIVTMTSKLNLPSLHHRMEIYKAVKAETIFLTLQIMNTPSDSFKNESSEDVSVRIWSILDQLRNIVKESQEVFDLDLILVNKIISHVLELNSICSDRMGTLHARIHPLKWAFLESLGFFSFFGILLLQAQSYRTELTMCIITVFSISLLCYVVSDLDSPFCGFFRIDLSALPEVVMRTRKAYELAKQGHNILVTYPSKNKTGYD